MRGNANYKYELRFYFYFNRLWLQKCFHSSRFLCRSLYERNVEIVAIYTTERFYLFFNWKGTSHRTKKDVITQNKCKNKSS